MLKMSKWMKNICDNTVTICQIGIRLTALYLLHFLSTHSFQLVRSKNQNVFDRSQEIVSEKGEFSANTETSFLARWMSNILWEKKIFGSFNLTHRDLFCVMLRCRIYVVFFTINCCLQSDNYLNINSSHTTFLIE